MALAISVVAALNIAGSIGTGYLSDRLDRSKLLAAIYAIRGFTFILLLMARTPFLLLLFAVVYGATEMASAYQLFVCALFPGKCGHHFLPLLQ